MGASRSSPSSQRRDWQTGDDPPPPLAKRDHSQQLELAIHESRCINLLGGDAGNGETANIVLPQR
jgi:hypothetical protein